MTPQEKANELVSKMLDEQSYSKELYDAKQCALIAVEFARENPLNTEGYNKYLDQVKQELELL